MISEEVIIERINIFYNSKTPIHLDETNGEFLNGYILEIGKGYVKILDRVQGSRTILIKYIDQLAEFLGDRTTLPKPKYLTKNDN